MIQKNNIDIVSNQFWWDNRREWKKNLLTIAEIIDNGSFTETPVQELRRLKRIAEKKPKPYDKK